MAKFKPVSKAEYVYQELRKQILSGELAQGEKIYANKLAEELGVSVIPIREAMGRLNAEGLVNYEAHKGVTVNIIEDKLIKEFFLIRSILEGYAARTAVKHINSNDLKILKKSVLQMDKCIELGQHKEYHKININFHQFIYDRSPHVLLKQLIYNLRYNEGWNKMLEMAKKDIYAANQEHKQIVEAIENKDGDKLELLIREHKMNRTKDIYKQIDLLDNKNKMMIYKIIQCYIGNI